MNNCIFIGRLTRDPEGKVSSSGTEYCTFSVAVDRSFKNKDGEREADFIPCKAWRAQSAFITKYFHKGDGIVVSGRLEVSKYVDKDGNNRTRYEIVAENVEFPPGRKSGGETGTGGAAFTDDEGELPGSGELPF